MAGSLQGYQNSILAGMGDPTAQQAVQRDTPGFDMFANVKTDNVAGMDMLSPTERRTQQYDSNRVRAEALNKEVEIGLGSRIDNVMSDADKQRYLNSLTKSQYEQMLKYKNEGYGFMASKELLENQYKLSDPNATGIMKYKDYADKDVYYNNNSDTIASSMWDKYIANPIGKLANYWNENLGFGEDAQNGNMNFADRFANLTLGNIINGLDAYTKGESRILNTIGSSAKSLYDRVVKGYDTDWDFYDKDREESIVDELIDKAYGGGQAALGVIGLMPGALPATAALSTKPGEKIGGITLGALSKATDWTLRNIAMPRGLYNSLSEDSQDKLSTGLAMVIVGRVGKGIKADLNARAEPYVRATKNMVKNGLEKAGEYAQAQRGFEEFQGTKNTPFIDMETGEIGTVSEFEGFKPGYRGRIASEAWEGFKEGVREKFYNPDGTNLSEFESTVQQGVVPGTEKTTGASVNGGKTTVDNTQQGGIVNTIGTSQLRQRNKMNKAQAVKFFNKYGTDYGNWMAQRGFNQAYDNNINALWDYAEYVQGQKADVLGTIRQRYNDPRVDDMLSDALAKAEYIKSPDLSKIESLALKNSQGGLTPQDVDWLRQWFGYNVPLRFDGTDVSGTVARNNNIYTAVREFLEEVADENGFSQLRDLNREIAATHHIIDATTRYYNGVATNDTVSLKDLVTLAGAMANPKARPVVIMQQVIKIPSIQDAILNKLIKGKTTTERNQIKIDLDKIKKIQDEAEQRRMLEEWIAKWNLKVEEATKAMSNRLPENITQGGVAAGDRGIVSPNPSSPTYQEMGLGTIRETVSPQYLLRAMVEQLKSMNLIDGVDTAKAIDYIMSNLTPEAQQTLANIAQKLSNGQPLTEQEGKIIEKLADVIRQDQDAIKNVEQPGLFDGLDNKPIDKQSYSTIKIYKDNLKELYDKATGDEYVYFVHNTPSENIQDIIKSGLRSYKSRGLDKHGHDDPSAIRGTLDKNHIGYGGNQIYFRIPKSEAEKLMVNGSQIMVYRDIKPEDIVAINPATSEKAGGILGKTNKADLFDFFDEGVKEYGYDYVKNRMVNEYGLRDEWEMFEREVLGNNLDNPEGTDINNTNLPTNPTNNGGITEGGNPGEGGLGMKQENGGYNENELGGTNGGGNQETLGEDMTGLGKSEGRIGKGKEIIEITDENEAAEVIDSILDRSNLGTVVGGMTLGDLEGLRTITNGERTAAVSINKDGKIVEYVHADDAPQGSADEILLKAIETGADKIDVDSEGLVEFFEKFGFRAVSRTGYKDTGYKYYMYHNGDVVDTVRNKLGQYGRNFLLSKIRWFSDGADAIKYRNELLDANKGYGDAIKELSNIKGWDGIKNYEDFDSRFKTEAEIKDFITEEFKSFSSSDATPQEDAIYSRELVKAVQVYNGHIKNKDVYVRYHKNGRALAKFFDEKGELFGVFSRHSVGIHVGITDGYTLPHEYTHEMDYKFGKELTGQSIRISDLAHYILITAKGKIKKPNAFKNIREELIWDFVDLYADIHKREYDGKSNSYKGKPTERFARMGEGFVRYVEGGEMLNTYGEEFPRSVAVKYAKILGKLDIARQNGELLDGELSRLIARPYLKKINIPDIGEVEIKYFLEGGS